MGMHALPPRQYHWPDAPGWQLRRNSATMAPSKRFPDGYNSRFSIALKNQSVVTSSWVTPCLQLLMHILDEPTLVSRIS